jgi:hypothetical protein
VHVVVVEPDGRWAARAVVALAAAGLMAGCSSGSGAGSDTPVVQAPPPAPPAACLLDAGKLAGTTGISWKADQTTASDTRCVYDPAAGSDVGASPTGEAAAAASDGPQFLAVTLGDATASDPTTELDTLAQVCDAGSRAPMVAADGAFVCRFRAGSVFAAEVRHGKVVTLAASAVPTGTTGARLVVAFGEQLAAIGR